MNALTQLSRGARFGGIFLKMLMIAGIIASLGLLDDGLAIDISRRLLAPSSAHWMGTDALGRDVLSLIFAGAASSLGIGLLSVLLGAAVGIPLGLVTAAKGGLISEAVSRGGDLIFAFPSLLLAVLLTAALGPGAKTTILAIAVFNVPVFARLVRGQCLSLMSRDFILAARMSNRSTAAIAFDHLLPNVAGLLVIQVALQVSLAIVAESGLSYVGLGVQPPFASWGRMLADAQSLVSVAPWLVAFPGSALMLAVLSFNLLADAVSSRWSDRTPRLDA
jgi:peptide/nickel transport system permease protein